MTDLSTQSQILKLTAKRLTPARDACKDCLHQMDKKLSEAINLLNSGEKEKSRQVLLELVFTHPSDPVVLHQCASTHDSMGLEEIEAGLLYAIDLNKVWKK
jgi:hypothetical protein